ncbi:MAG TPA: shikimate kinase [Candidatus Omnitrophota bacterium]|nr:shikimate kinase [Candidatus Omnitrophota bacterium]
MLRNIALVGFMGSGKTTVSYLLAQHLHYRLISTDALIVEQEKISVAEIFAVKGEQYFRSLERNIVEQLSGQQGLVIDCGGGIVLQQENMDRLRSSGLIVYLKATVDILHERTRHSKERPLLNVEDPKARIKNLLAQRECLYQKADVTIDTSQKTVAQVVDEIAERVFRGSA